MFLYCNGNLQQRTNGNIRCDGTITTLSDQDLTALVLSNAPQLDLDYLIAAFQPSVVEVFLYTLFLGMSAGFATGLVLNVVKRGRNL